METGNFYNFYRTLLLALAGTELFLSCKTETLYPLNADPHAQPRSAPGNPHSAVCLCGLDHFGYLRSAGSHSICSVVTGLFHTARCPQDSSMSQRESHFLRLTHKCLAAYRPHFVCPFVGQWPIGLRPPLGHGG